MRLEGVSGAGPIHALHVIASSTGSWSVSQSKSPGSPSRTRARGCPASESGNCVITPAQAAYDIGAHAIQVPTTHLLEQHNTVGTAAAAAPPAGFEPAHTAPWPIVYGCRQCCDLHRCCSVAFELSGDPR